MATFRQLILLCKLLNTFCASKSRTIVDNDIYVGTFVVSSRGRHYGTRGYTLILVVVDEKSISSLLDGDQKNNKTP